MNAKEFAALKEGDILENPMSSSFGKVTKTDKTGVWVLWADSGRKLADGDHAGTERHYIFQSTIWFHWTYAPRDCTAGPCYREDCRRGDQCLGGDYAKITAGQ